jgi:hypothetical protein
VWLRLSLIAVVSCGRSGFEPVRDAPPDAAPPLPPPDYCAGIPPLASPPTIDGVVEPGVVLQSLVPVGWESVLDPLPPIPDVSARFAIAYRPDGIYFFVDVDDASRFPATELSYCGDGVELYIDHDAQYSNLPKYDLDGAGQFIAFAPASDTGSRSEGDVWVSTARQRAWQGGFAAFARPGGYSLEAFIDASALELARWSLVAGGRVGVDLSINMSRDDGAILPISECDNNLRLGQFYLRIDEAGIGQEGNGAPWWTPTAFCTPALE